MSFELKPADKRIFFVIGSLEVGGAERHLTQVALSLKKRGWQPEVFTFTAGGPLSSQLLVGGVPVRSAIQPSWIAKIIGSARWQARVSLVITCLVLLKTLIRFRPRIIHFFLPSAYLLGGLVSLLFPSTVKIMSRRSLRHYQAAHPRLARVERWLHPHMALICGNSKAVVCELAEEGVKPKCLRLIYNGVDLDAFSFSFDRQAERIKASLKPDMLVFVMVANLIPYKGHADLINAFASIRESIKSPWTVLLIGRDDGIGADLRRQTHALGLSENIRFLGPRNDVPRLLRMADVGVLCSHQEGFSNAVIEAMAASLPVVVTDVGGNAEAVTHLQTGLVVPSKNPEQLGQALLAMLLRTDRQLMGERGQQRVARLFSMHACVSNYEAMYREILCVE